MNNRIPSLVSWIAQIVAVAIMGQTLYFKFSGSPESVQLFSELGMEPEGRLLIGILELIACILLLIPSSVTYGAILGSALMVGAVIGHFTKLGWEGDRGPRSLLRGPLHPSAHHSAIGIRASGSGWCGTTGSLSLSAYFSSRSVEEHRFGQAPWHSLTIVS